MLAFFSLVAWRLRGRIHRVVVCAWIPARSDRIWLRAGHARRGWWLAALLGRWKQGHGLEVVIWPGGRRVVVVHIGWTAKRLLQGVDSCSRPISSRGAGLG